MTTTAQQIADLEAQRAALMPGEGAPPGKVPPLGTRIGAGPSFLRRAKVQSIGNELDRLNLDPDWAHKNPEAAAGEITRRQFELYQARGMGLEDSVLDEITDPASAERAATRAGISAREAFAGAGAMTDRRLERHGVQATAEQRAGNARRADLAQAMAVGGAKQTAREATRDGDIDLLSGALNVGANLSSASTTAADSAAGMAHAREQTYQNQKAQHQQSMISSGLMGAGLAAAAGASAAGIAGGGLAGLALLAI